MRWETWLLFVVTETAVSLTPGPGVLFILSQSLRWGASSSVFAACGIILANTIYFILSATSLSGIIASSYYFFALIKWTGAGYLIYLGVQSFVKPSSRFTTVRFSNSRDDAWKAFKGGVVLQGANPKALIFFTAIVPQFLDKSHRIGPQITLLGVSAIIIDFLILLMYGYLAARFLVVAGQPRFETLTNRIAGCLLITAAFGLARLRRN